MALFGTPLSLGGESLVDRIEIFDVVIVGSGYGGSVAAARLTDHLHKSSGEPLTVCVLERGLEHPPGSFPSRFADLPGHIRINRSDTPEITGDAAGLFDLRIGEDVSVLVGNGLGGGSLINASVAEEPDREVFRSWPGPLRDPRELRRYFDVAAGMLGASPAATEGLRKYREFASWAEGLGLRPQPARVAVTFRSTDDNGHGVRQDACINCGDCVTGCNFHAKNTLPMNYLARAKRNKAKIYTGVTVSHVEPTANSEWIVHYRLTPRPGSRSWDRELRRLAARHVILAAGSLGSTEILMRSKDHGLQVSDQLGKHFSCNGDMISALYDQDCYVNAGAPEHSLPKERNVGPTITGIARTRGKRGKRLVLEELAIPASLRRVFEEVVTTGALPYRLAGFGSGSLFGERVDCEAVNPAAVDRTQVFAAMGEDHAKGCLKPIPGWNAGSNPKIVDGCVTVEWPEAGQEPVYRRQDRCMSRRTTNGGEYLRSPLWQPLPIEFSANLSGQKPKGKLFTVHPLGGCRMAESAKDGVVNHLGQVFRVGARGEELYPNLLVLDGSIVPSALGINPLLTITALAERAIERYIDDQASWHRGKVDAPPPLPQSAVRPTHVPWVVRRLGRAIGAYALADRLASPPSERWREDDAARTNLRFAERVRGDLDLDSAHETRLELHFEPVRDIPGFWRDPKRALKIEKGRLQALPRGEKMADEEHWPGAAVSGSVVLVEPVRLSAFTRTFVALYAFLRRRGIADWLQGKREKRAGNATPPRHPTELVATEAEIRAGELFEKCACALAVLAGIAAQIGRLLWPLWLLARRWSGGCADALAAWVLKKFPALGFVPLAYQIGEARSLRYSLVLEDKLRLKKGVLPKGTRIEGTKILRYTVDGNPWWQLFELPVTITRPESTRAIHGTLSVDLGYFFRRYATQLQITQQRDLPAALIDVFSTVLFLLRMVAKIHFWSFRLPEYQKHDPKIVERRTPGDLPGLERKQHWLDEEDRPSPVGKLPKLLLTHYRTKGGQPGKPVVLFHGLGASGNQFATDKLDKNLVQHLAENGRDVWVAEMRHSIAMPVSSLEQWSLDEIGLNDVPRLVGKVIELSRQPTVDVVAHCIGSAMFCTAALAGRLQGLIGSAVLMQVGPIIKLSEGTKIRAYLAAFLRRYVRETHVDFSVDDKADWMDSLIDRVLATYPYPAAEERHHALRPPWVPQLHLANCNRWATIDGRMIEHHNLSPEMLKSLGEILGHANLKTWEQTIQYAYLERLTDAEGCNTYVTHDNIKNHFDFPIRFIHGKENDVFDVRTSRKSCELLKETFGADHPCDVQELEGYSHLDPLIGKNADRDVYPLISKFLSADRTVEGRVRRKFTDIRWSLVGPVLGWTRRDPNSDEWVTRLWCRVDDTRSPCSYIMVVPVKNGDVMPIHKIKKAFPASSRLDTLAVVDVVLDAEDTDYELIVLSVHLLDRREEKLAEVFPNKEYLKPAATFLVPEEIEIAPQELEKRLKQVRELLTMRRQGDDQCTTHPEYDRVLTGAHLSRRVLEQNSSDKLRFAFGSCRYGASVLDRECADAVFGRLRRLVEDPTEAHTPAFLLLVGDQIYADQTAGVFDSGGRRERFYEAYREAWTAPNARAVLSRLPTYMMLDDHEVGDNWHPLDHGTDDRELRGHGLAAFQEYQLLHSPKHEQLSPAANVEKLPAHRFWYQFRAGRDNAFPFFVFDTRTTRERDKIVRDEQMGEFKTWLGKQDKEVPKFVVSPSLVVPFRATKGPKQAHASGSDGWDGYPASLQELFRALWETRAKNVVFLCGDAHLSVASRIVLRDAAGGSPDLTAYCVVSSGFYTPFPFANSKPEDYVQTLSHPVQVDANVSMTYEIVDGRWLAGTGNFTLVEAERAGSDWGIRLRRYRAHGDPQVVELTAVRPSGGLARGGGAGHSHAPQEPERDRKVKEVPADAVDERRPVGAGEVEDHA